jgi:hypothetical protein
VLIYWEFILNFCQKIKDKLPNYYQKVFKNPEEEIPWLPCFLWILGSERLTLENTHFNIKQQGPILSTLGMFSQNFRTQLSSGQNIQITGCSIHTLTHTHINIYTSIFLSHKSVNVDNMGLWPALLYLSNKIVYL